MLRSNLNHLLDNSFAVLLLLFCMAKVNSLPEILSLSKLLGVPKPRELLKEELIKLLKARLKKLRIIWNPESFAGGLSNPKIPRDLLDKLEGLISLAEACNWKLSPQAKLELDETIEDIESFNPSFRKELDKELKEAEEDWKKGRFVPGEEIEKRLGIK